MADSKLRIILETIKKGKGAKDTEKEVNKLNNSLAKMAKVAAAGFIAFKTLGKAFGLTIGNAIESERLMAATVNVIEATGKAAGVTAKEIDDYAETLQRLSGVDSEVIQGGQNLLLTFKEIKSEGGVFDRATRSMLDMAVAMNQGNLEGIDLKATSIQLGKALNVAAGDTTAAGIALSAMARVGVSFSDSQKKAAIEAVKLGNVLEFQNIILKELESEFGGAAEAAGETLAGQLSKLELEVGDLGQTLGDEMLPAIVDVVSGLNILIAASGETNDAIIEMAQSGGAFEKAGASIAILTTGAERLSDAWIENRAKMLNMVIAGELTVEQFNEASLATGKLAFQAGANRDAMLAETQAMGELSQGLVDAIALGRDMEATDLALIQARGSVKNVTEELIPTEAELAEAEKIVTQAAKEQAAAEREVAESLAAARQGAADASIEFNNLAQSLVDATNADLAKVAIDGLDQSLKDGLITRGEHADATRNVMLSFDLATDASLRMADSMGDVNQLFADGKISGDELVEIIGALDENEGNLDKTLKELDIKFGGIHDIQGEVELSALALNTAHGDAVSLVEDLTEKSEELTDQFSELKDREFDVGLAAELVKDGVEATIGPVTASGNAAGDAAKNWLKLAEAMDLAASGGGAIPLPGGAPPSIPTFAHGGNIGRFGIVGEQGPELVVGNRAFSSPDTDRLIAAIQTLVESFPNLNRPNVVNNNFSGGATPASLGAHHRAIINGGR